jgi:UDP-N-acetylglucosamine--N-acetylmuramyl-(pentapeptide) pyrophosphoryl-undecaprenol N-acetylglucosamine transferase
MFQSFYYLFRLKPDLVFSKGGYVALPVVVSAYLLRIPVIIHESDSIPGLTTKISSIFAKQVWAKNNFLSKKQSFKFRKVALPVRSELFNGSKTYFTKKFNLSTDNPTLLVMGGSLGAEAINQFVFKNSTTLLKKYNIIHITGRGKASKSLSNPNYLQFDYLDDEMAHAYAAADFILTRAGAGALNEISALNKKAILVPLTKDQSRGEQIINAEIFVKENPAILILQNNLNLDKFESAISRLSKLGKNQGEQASIFDPELILSFFVNK